MTVRTVELQEDLSERMTFRRKWCLGTCEVQGAVGTQGRGICSNLSRQRRLPTSEVLTGRQIRINTPQGGKAGAGDG